MGSEWGQCCLARLVRANVIACCLSASVVVGFDQDVRVVYCLDVSTSVLNQGQAPEDMVVWPRLGECAWLNSSVNCFLRVWLQCSASLGLAMSDCALSDLVHRPGRQRR